MKLVLVGMNWKTPVGLRERLAFDVASARTALDGLKSTVPTAEYAILSTCNRTELYAAETADEVRVTAGGLAEYLADFHHVPLSEFMLHLYCVENGDAAEHLFKVAAGLDSLVLGESQILGQVKQAYQQAKEATTAGTVLHALFQRALSAAKRVHSETTLTRGHLSIASAAVDYARGVFDRFDDKSILVIGAGKMAELVLTHLKGLVPKSVLVCNRTRQRAIEVVARHGGIVREFADLRAALVDADIVLSSTGAGEPLVYAPEFEGIMADRKQRLIAVIDIAVPRDFDPAIAKIDNVLLWNIDDLESVTQRTLRQRENEFDKAIKIIEEETRTFLASMAFMQTSPVIGKLEQEYQRVIDSELEWLLPQLNGVAPEHRDKIRQFAHRLKNKLLHQPRTALRVDASSGGQHGLLDALRKLFGLHDI